MRWAFIGLLFLSQGARSLTLKDFEARFFTDDSPQYIQLTTEGFKQRVRIHKDICQKIAKVEIEFEATSIRASSTRRGLTSLWPPLYGLQEHNWCWFEVEALGLDLNQAEKNHYWLKLTTTEGSVWTYSEDGDSVLPWRRITTHRSSPPGSLGPWGATPIAKGGVFFKIWEPHANEVHLFINKSATALVMHPNRSAKGGLGLHHVLYLPEAKIGDEYHFQFVKDGKYESLVVNNTNRPSPIKVDPAARELRHDGKGGALNGYENPRAVVASALRPDSQGALRPLDSPKAQAWLIYQLWPMAFNPKFTGGRWQQGTFKDISQRIGHIKDLGVTAVELLPVNESRFYAGWGYALNSLTLIESTLGRREDLHQLVEHFHQAGIRVIFDAVLNHINNDLWREPISPSVKKSKFYNGDTPWGSKPDFANPWVRRFLAQSLLSWVREYRIDGLRFDMTKYIYEESPEGWTFLKELTQLFKVEHPGFYLSAEELPNNIYVTRPLSEGGLGFDSQWNDRFKNSFELEFDDYRATNKKLNLVPLANAVKGLSSHQGRSGDLPFGAPHRAVNYLGSHDFIGNKNPLLRIISGYQSFERELGQTFTRVRPLEEPRNPLYQFRLIHNDFTHATLRTAYLVLFTTPGPALFFQGEELAQDLNIENEWSYVDPIKDNSQPSKNIDIHRYVGSHRMPWDYLTPGKGELDFLAESEKALFLGHHRLFKDLIRWRKALNSFDSMSAEPVKLYPNLSLLTYVVGHGEEKFLVLANFGQRLTDEWITFPKIFAEDTWWCEVFNTSDKIYGGKANSFRNLIPHLGGRDNHMRLEASSAVVFRAEKGFKPSELLNLWLDGRKISLKSFAQGELAAQFSLNAPQAIEFYIASQDGEALYGAGTSPVKSKSTLLAEPLASTNGYLSYVFNRSPAKVSLGPGQYKFQLNTRNYQYSFTKL